MKKVCLALAVMLVASVGLAQSPDFDFVVVAEADCGTHFETYVDVIAVGAMWGMNALYFDAGVVFDAGAWFNGSWNSLDVGDNISWGWWGKVSFGGANWIAWAGGTGTGPAPCGVGPALHLPFEYTSGHGFMQFYPENNAIEIVPGGSLGSHNGWETIAPCADADAISIRNGTGVFAGASGGLQATLRLKSTAPLSFVVTQPHTGGPYDFCNSPTLNPVLGPDGLPYVFSGGDGDGDCSALDEFEGDAEDAIALAEAVGAEGKYLDKAVAALADENDAKALKYALKAAKKACKDVEE